MESLLLENAHLRMRVSPQGGSLLSLESLRFQQPVLQAPKGEFALFPMLPLANRVANNRFRFNEREIALPHHEADDAFFLHGDGWLKKWRVMAAAPERCTLQLHSQLSCGYDYEATLEYKLTGDTLSVALTLVHQGAQPMLYGCGFHPWFYFTNQYRAQFHVSGCWPEGESHLPLAWQSHIPPAADFSDAKYGEDAWLNMGYSGWNGCAVIENDVMRVTLLAQTPYLMAFRMSDGAFLCLEPQTHPVNAHNLPGQPGLQVLGQGDRLQFSLKIAVEKGS